MSINNIREILGKTKNMYFELESIRMTLINIQIAVSTLLDHPEARVLTTIATHVEQSILNIEKEIEEVEELAKGD